MDSATRSSFRAMQAIAVEATSGFVPQLTVHSDVVAVPPAIWRDPAGNEDFTPGRARLSGGVFQEDCPIRASAHYEGPVELMSPDANAHKAAVDELSGRWLYLGLGVEHLGHFLMESLGRNWALDEPASGRLDGAVLFLEPGLAGQLPEQNADLLHLALGVPVRIVTVPTRIEELVIARQESFSGFGMLSSARQIAAMRSRLRPGLADADEVVYVSRAGTGPASQGRILGGAELESIMRSRGIRVLRPETLSIAEQLQAYRGARILLVEDGTPVHLIAVSASERSTVILLPRRPWMRLFLEAHLGLYLGEAAVVESIDAGFPLWSPAAGSLQVWQVVDARVLQHHLERIDEAFGAPEWPKADLEVVERDRLELEAHFGAPLVPFGLDQLTALTQDGKRQAVVDAEAPVRESEGSVLRRGGSLRRLLRSLASRIRG